MAFILNLIFFVLGVFVYTPAFRRQMRLAESDGSRSPTYQAAAQLDNILLVMVAFLAVLIVFLMVVKPAL